MALADNETADLIGSDKIEGTAVYGVGRTQNAALNWRMLDGGFGLNTECCECIEHAAVSVVLRRCLRPRLMDQKSSSPGWPRD